MDASSYWSPLCRLVSKLRCWSRVRWREGSETVDGRWGQLLIVPTAGYLESSEGPVRMADVEWVDVSTARVRGGIAGRPRTMIDIKDDLLAALRETSLTWELRDGVWSIERVFEEEPVLIVRVPSPFGPTAAGRP